MDEPKLTPDGMIIREIRACSNVQGIGPCILHIKPGITFTIETLMISSPERMVGVLLHPDIEIVFVPTYAILLFPEYASTKFGLARDIVIRGDEYYLTWQYGKPFTLEPSDDIDESFRPISQPRSVFFFNSEQMEILQGDMELAMQVGLWLWLIYAGGRDV